MSNIFTIGNVTDFADQINIDELYDKKKNFDLSKLELFNKILNRIHMRIKHTSRRTLADRHCWHVVPEIIIGITKYNHAECLAYIIDKLKTNGFYVKYYHPNLLFISWTHWVPSYVRTELKNKTGIIINEFGENLSEKSDNNNNNNNNNK